LRSDNLLAVHSGPLSTRPAAPRAPESPDRGGTRAAPRRLPSPCKRHYVSWAGRRLPRSSPRWAS